MSAPVDTLRSADRILQNLDAAIGYCASLGLTQPGRFAVYRSRLRGLADRLARGDNSIIPDPTPLRVALTESVEFGELVPLLARFDQGVVKRKLRDVLGGPAEPSDEDPDSSHARNIQFELWFAGILARGGLYTDVGESPDVICRPLRPWQFFIECKRVFSPKKVDERIKEAAEQLRTSLRGALPTTRGVIAISLSPVMNPGAAAYRIQGARAGSQALEDWLDDVVEATRPRCDDLFARGRIVGLFYETASDFENLETGKFDRGRQVTVRTYEPLTGPYNRALDRMCEEVKKLKTIVD